ncbi:MAG: replicative DNA helicase [Eubacteriales bacterium]|jgi:replicative DNA helicase|nr:replicative DNA helicase [Eubacteriales bacterium]MCI6028933.1 replicative DNA helicase [Clostridiales bacterium]MDD7415002.1 replicative DNA helicase [Clostridiales bacterium]MDY5732219.1 replicative DNA helicase [Eubacteriales bacterium]
MEEVNIVEQTSAQPIPFSEDAEKSVLGSMMLSAEAVDLASEALNTEDFYIPKHRQIFAAMLDINARNGAVDVVTLLEELERRGTADSSGGIEYLTELSIFTPSAANVSNYIKIVEERSIMRRLMHAGTAITRDAMQGSKSVEAMLDDAERRIFNIAMHNNEDTLTQIRPVVYESYQRINTLINLKGKLTGVPTGYTDLDSMTSGLQKSDLIIIAARPSQGKTALGLNIAAHAAIREGKTVAIFSLEMSKEQLVMRLFASEARVNMQNVNHGTPSSQELLKLAEANLTLANANMYIDDRSNISVAEIRSKCRRLKARNGLDMIVIDYLQLMKTPNGSDNRVQEVSELTRSLKILARELNVPIVLLSQLSRKAAERKPAMSDLRESGAIEQDADIIIMIYRDPSRTDDNSAEIIVAKNRNGPVDSIFLTWIGEYTRFENRTLREE